MRWLVASTFAIAMAASPLALAQEPARDPAAIEEAKKHMEAGAALYNDPSGHKCEEAYREFKRAQELSGSLNALKGMAVCALELERDGEAIEHYERFLQLKGDKIDPGDKAQAETDLKELRAAVAWVTVRTDRPNARLSDVRTPAKGYPITNRYDVGASGAKIGVHPGAHVFTASADGVADVTWRVEVTNGGTYEHTFDLGGARAHAGVPVEDRGPKRPVPTYVYVLAGVSAALAIPTVALMVRAKSLKDDYDANNDGTVDSASLENQRSEVKSANLLADVFLGGTLAAVAATSVLYLTRPTRQPANVTGRAKPHAASNWVFSPTVGGAAMRGRF